MADTLTTKKVTELTENTAMSDNDLFMVGSAGTASLRKLKWSNIWNTIKTAILGKLVANNLTTTAAGYLLDARQGKALDDKISKLNTDLTNGYKLYHGIETITVTANTNKSVSISKPSGWSKIIGAVVSGNTNPYTIDYSSVKPVVTDSGVTIIVSNPTASGEFKIGYLLFGV